jgi:hypothetical protein
VAGVEYDMTAKRLKEGIEVAEDSSQPVRGHKEATMQEKETLDERLPSLFEPDTLLPVQYFEAMRRKHLLEGEKRLILSVLEDGIECFMKYVDAPTSKGQKLFRDAEEWINLRDKQWIFSFDNVCDMLDIHPDYMRRGLHEWKQKKLARLGLQQLEPSGAEVKAHHADRPGQRKPEMAPQKRHLQLHKVHA